MKISLCVYITISCVISLAAGALPVVVVKNSKIFVNNEEFVVKGVNYSPSPIGQQGMSNGYGGTGFCSAKLTPWNEWKSACYDSDYYDGSSDVNSARFPTGFKPLWERDFPKIKALGANTIRLYNTNPSTRAATKEYTNLFPYPTGKDHTQFVKYAEDNKLFIVYPLFTDDWSYDNVDEFTFKRYLRWQIDEVGNSPAILMWQFGNEMGWMWYGSDRWNNDAAAAKFNRYLNYIRRYTLSKWGRSIPITAAIPNFVEQYNYQYQNWNVDIFSANVFSSDYGYLFGGTGDFRGVSTLSCVYNKPFLMTEIAPGWAPGAAYPAGAFNLIWNGVVNNLQNGLLGAIWFELTDEPALGKDFGFFALSANTVNGVSSTAADGFVADTITPKLMYQDAVQGTYNGQPYNMNANVFSLLGRSPANFSTATDRCASMNLKQCPGSGYPKCSGNGACDRSTGTCTCAVGWSGTACSIAVCPKSSSGATCSGRGGCSNLVTPPECVCSSGYYGAACELSVANLQTSQCPNSCSLGNGVCTPVTGGRSVCVCHSGWAGLDCSVHDIGYGTVNIQQYFVGCLAQPSLAVTAPTIQGLTNQKCREYCATRGYTYSGTSAGSKCMCGNTLASTATGSCSYACGGDTRQACGGATQVNVYLAGSKTDVGYLGCYTDDATRDLPIQAYDDVTGNTVDRCRAACASQGRAYAAVQNGNQCFCGDSYGNIGKTGNLALRRSATADGVYPYQSNWGIANAFDGNPGTSWQTGQISGAGMWLQVDLGGTFTITSVKWLPRQDGCCPERNQGFVVKLLRSSDPNDVVATYSNIGDQTNNYQTITVSPAVNAAFVRLEGSSVSGPYLTAAEFEVYGTQGGGRVDDSQCSAPCSGDSTLFCGAGWRNSIYTSALPVGYNLYQ